MVHLRSLEVVGFDKWTANVGKGMGMLSIEVIVNGISIVILASLTLVPFVNVVVGTVVGGSLAGAVGLSVGALLALLITAVEVVLLQSRTSFTDQAANPMKILGTAIVSLAEWRRHRSRTATDQEASSAELSATKYRQRQAA
jgi:hypothetical protein